MSRKVLSFETKVRCSTKTQLSNLAAFVAELARSGRPVLKLYGSYYSALLFGVGLVGFACDLDTERQERPSIRRPPQAPRAALLHSVLA